MIRRTSIMKQSSRSRLSERTPLQTTPSTWRARNCRLVEFRALTCPTQNSWQSLLGDHLNSFWSGILRGKVVVEWGKEIHILVLKKHEEGHGGVVVRPSPCRKKVLLCVGFLTQPKDVQIRSVGYSELSIGVNVSVNGCPSPCVSPVINCQNARSCGHLALCPESAGIWAPASLWPLTNSSIDNGWKTHSMYTDENVV